MSNQYHSFYILRIWQEHDPFSLQADPLRIVLEDPRQQQRWTFPTFRQLLTHLETQTEQNYDISNNR